MATPADIAIAVVGPTSSGKSELALDLAESFRGEIVNCDSIQLFRGFDIGTAKPSPEDRRRAVHHLIDILAPEEVATAGDYQRRARRAIAQIHNRRKLPILVGGTGLYLRAVVDGLFDAPPSSEYWRSRLAALATARGRLYLHRLLMRLDPETAARVGVRDTSKVIRALEILLQTGSSLSEHLKDRARHPLKGCQVSIIGLNPPRQDLYRRIEERVHLIFRAGLVEEVRSLLDEGIPRSANAFRAIGYRRVLEYLDGIISLDEAIVLTERDTRRYAKRQMTWFRRQHRVTWFDGFGSEQENKERIRRFVNQLLGDSKAAVCLPLREADPGP